MHNSHFLLRNSEYFRNFAPKLKTNSMIEVVDFSKTNSVINLYMSELRDKNYQKNRLLFRHNIKRVGEMMAYELSKTLEYRPKTITTPLGTLDIQLPKEDLLIATVLRAGLPFHEGFINVFDHADNAFVSAYRMYTNREHTEVGVHTEYLAAPSAKGKTLVIVDPMLATGGSMAASIEALVKTGKPKKIHIACVIAVPEGLEVVKSVLPEGSTIWCAAVDPGMNEHKYIVPGFGDCGDLCYGEKL
jgi:uracil phosphoribosyltransferase